MEIYKAILDTLVCLAACATGASAVVALVHYLRHWRDDEAKLALRLDEQETDTDRHGRATWIGTITITNVGKVPVTVTGFEFVDKPLREMFEINGRLDTKIFIDQGAAEKAYALVWAKKPGVAIPQRIAIRCTWAKPKQACNGVIAIDLADARPARQ